MAAVRTEVLHKDDVPPDLNAQISKMFREVFTYIDATGYDASTGIEWDAGDYRVLVWEDDVWAGIAEVGDREIVVGGNPVRVGTIGGVMTLPQFRGHGLGRAVMDRAVQFMCEELRVNVAMLFCSDYNLPFYASLGWQTLEREITYQQSDGEHKLGAENAMIWPCGNFIMLAGAIHLQGKLW